MERATLSNTNGAADAPNKARVSIKNLYAIGNLGSLSRRSAIRWSEYADPDVEEKELQRLTAGYDIVHRKERGQDRHGNTSWQTHSILIRGGLKRDVLAKALAGYPNLNLEASEMEFKPPFEPLVHRWAKLQESVTEMKTLAVTADDRTRVDNNVVLMKTLKDVISSSLTALDKIKRTDQVEFDMLWMLFPPGELVVSYESGVEQVYRVLAPLKLVTPEGSPPYWNAKYEYLDWNGHVTGFAATGSPFHHYEGSQPIQAFHLVPLSGHPESKQIISRVTQRGRRFEGLRGYHFKVCEGTRETKNTLKPVSPDTRQDNLIL